MTVSFTFDEKVILVTGACGALGSAVVTGFEAAGATVCGADIVPPEDDDALVDPDRLDFYETDATDEASVEATIDDIIADHGQIDVLCNIAGTWRGGHPIDETPLDEFELLVDINFKSMFLTSKHAIPHLRDTDGAIVSVSARSSLEGGAGDGPYRASKAGVRLLTETIADENRGDIHATAIMPSVIDTPMNREMMPDADHDTWVAPATIARVIMFLSSPDAAVSSGAAVPVYGDA